MTKTREELVADVEEARGMLDDLRNEEAMAKHRVRKAQVALDEAILALGGPGAVQELETAQRAAERERARAERAAARAEEREQSKATRAADREKAKAGKQIEKIVKDASKRALGSGKDPEGAEKFARALLAAGYVQGMRRRFVKGTDAFRQADDGTWLRMLKDKPDGWLWITHDRMGNQVSLGAAMEALISRGFARP